jgi:hypothetical protein
MRQVETLTLVLLLAFGLFGVGFSVCRDFMDMDESKMAGACQDEDDCQKTCRFGQDESPAVFEKIQPQVFSDTVAVLVLHLMPPLSPHLHLLHETTSRLEVHSKLPIGEVYLQNASFLI